MEEFVGEQLEFKDVPWRNPGEGSECYFLALADLPATALTRTAFLGRARGNDLDKQPADQVELYPISGEELTLFTQTNNICLPHYLRNKQIWAFNLEVGQIPDPTVLIPIEELNIGEAMVRLRSDMPALVLAEETHQNLEPYVDLFKNSSDKNIRQLLRFSALRRKFQQGKTDNIEGQGVLTFGLNNTSLLTQGGFNQDDFYTSEDQVWFEQLITNWRTQEVVISQAA